MAKKTTPRLQAVAPVPAPEAARALDPEEREAMIRDRAHELFLLRGDAPGSAMDDWLQAEREVDLRLATKLAA